MKDCDPEVVCDTWGHLTKRDMYCGGSKANVIAAPEDKIDCNQNPDHPLCYGKRGQDGFIFCDLCTEGSGMSCYDNDDVTDNDPRVYCAEDPETKEACKLTDSENIEFIDSIIL